MNMAMVENGALLEGIQAGWHLRGTCHEACAFEGHCPYCFGRDKEGGCWYLMVFRIEEGQANGVNLTGTVVLYAGDLPHSTYAEVAAKGSEGGIYVGAAATPEQREVLDLLVTQTIEGVLMKKRFGVKYVDIEVTKTAGEVQVSVPLGKMAQRPTTGLDGRPVRLENQTLPSLSDVKACHTLFWSYEDYGKHFEYRDRCATWTDLEMAD
jgi:hypothetical protein